MDRRHFEQRDATPLADSIEHQSCSDCCAASLAGSYGVAQCWKSEQVTA
jgi:hypothetical protein